MGTQDIIVWIILGVVGLYAAWHTYQVLTGRKNDCNCSGCDKADAPGGCSGSQPSVKDETHG
ncbi:MAG: hypothetical protein ACYTGH_12060 [Planctomycetota bacterium]|jgi:hypothetical protein